MSTVFNVHTITPFVSGKSEALPEQRLAKVSYKLTSAMKREGITSVPTSVCVSLPPLQWETIEPFVGELKDHIIDLCHKAQDGIVRSVYEEAGHKAGIGISDDQVGMPAIIAYLSAQATGGKLSKELIAQWFNESCRDNIFVAMAESNGLCDAEGNLVEGAEKKLNESCNGILGMLQALNVEKPTHSPNQIRACRRALEVAAVDGNEWVQRKLTEKLDQLEKKPIMEVLGF